jgi:hypothetical protein
LKLPSQDADENTLIDFISQFPPGPPLLSAMLPRAIKKKLHLVDGPAAYEAIQEANALRRKVGSRDIVETAVLIFPPNIEKTGPIEYWQRAVEDATLKGPQTTVALLLGLPRNLLHGLDEVTSQFLQELLMHR